MTVNGLGIEPHQQHFFFFLQAPDSFKKTRLYKGFQKLYLLKLTNPICGPTHHHGDPKWNTELNAQVDY